MKNQNLVLQSCENSIIINAPQAESISPMGGTSTTGMKVTLKRGNLSGIGASVSGAGAYARMKGSFAFTLKHLEHSKSYTEMVEKYNISGGVAGFWSWIGVSSNVSKYREEIHSALNEVFDSSLVQGTVNVDLMVTGLYPNVQVDASAYVQVLQITDEQGSTTVVFSTSNPKDDVGAQDQNQNDLPVDDNNSTIEL